MGLFIVNLCSAAEWNEERLMDNYIRCDQSYDLVEINMNPFLKKRTFWIQATNDSQDETRTIWLRELSKNATFPSYINDNPLNQEEEIEIKTFKAICKTFSNENPMRIQCEWGKTFGFSSKYQFEAIQQIFDGTLYPYALNGVAKGFQLFGKTSTFQCYFPERPIE